MDTVFAFWSVRIKTKAGGNKTGNCCCWSAGKVELCCRKQGAWRPASKAFFTLVTPSKPVMSLLRNSLKEIIRFVHNNVLENREKHPKLFWQEVRQKSSSENSVWLKIRPTYITSEADRPPLPSVWKGHRGNWSLGGLASRPLRWASMLNELTQWAQ